MTTPSWGSRPSLGPIAAAAAAAREDWRSEQEAASADAVAQFHHQRDLRNVLNECMRNGDRVAVVVGPHRAVGQIVEIAEDLVSVRNLGSGRYDFQVRPDVAFEVIVQEAAVGQPGGDELASGSFRARLLEREAADAESTIGSLLRTEPIDGKLVVGADHVRVVGRGGGETLLPMHAIAYVAPRRD